jgi:hypothetical protein
MIISEAATTTTTITETTITIKTLLSSSTLPPKELPPDAFRKRIDQEKFIQHTPSKLLHLIIATSCI